MKASPALSSFNAGELSPWMEGRIDNEKYPAGCHLLQNFLCLVEGPALRRPGERYVGMVKNPANRTWLRPFVFSPTEAYQIEFGDGYCRFYTNYGVLTPGTVSAWNSGTSYVLGNLALYQGIVYYCTAANSNQQPPNAAYWYAQPPGIYEIPSPYAGADLTSPQGTFNFGIEQSADVLYIAGGAAGYQAHTLTRFSDTNWQFAVFFPLDGPFIEENTTTTTISPSARTGSITLTASAPIFAATDVGRLVRLQVQNFSIEAWQGNTGFNSGTEASSNGHTYIAQISAQTGEDPPEHLEGIAFDGGGNTGEGVSWLYEDSGYGIVKITGFTDAEHVTATVTVNADNGLSASGLPSSLTSTPTRHWTLGAWSNTTEFPRTVSFFLDRLYWAGKLRWWASIPGLYTSYVGDAFGQVTTDSGMAGIISANEVSTILWLSPALKLLIGTDGGEFGLGPITSVNPVGPDNVQVSIQSKKGCRQVRPQLINTSVLYVQRAGRKVMAMDYNFYLDRYDSTNQNRLAYHMTQTGVCDLAYQSEPFQVLWATRTDGLLIGYTFDREDNVTGWHRHPVGGAGIVECVSALPAPDGSQDDLWMIVNRTINGQTVRSVGFLEKHYEPGDLQSSCFYVDMGLTYNGAPTTNITGLDYLDNQIVSVLKDGAVHPRVPVIGGAITLMSPGSVVQVGLPCPAILTTMRIEAGADAGTSQGKLKRVYHAIIRLIDSLGGLFGMENGQLDDIRTSDPSVGLDASAPIYDGDTRGSFPGTYDTDCRLTVQQNDPLPMTVAAIFPNLVGEEPGG